MPRRAAARKAASRDGRDAAREPIAPAGVFFGRPFVHTGPLCFPVSDAGTRMAAVMARKRGSAARYRMRRGGREQAAPAEKISVPLVFCFRPPFFYGIT